MSACLSRRRGLSNILIETFKNQRRSLPLLGALQNNQRCLNRSNVFQSLPLGPMIVLKFFYAFLQALNPFVLHVPSLSILALVALSASKVTAQGSISSILEDIRRDKPVPVVDAPDLSQSGSSGAGMSPWLFPDSSLRKLGQEEVFLLGKEQLWRARNEIFARRGYIFNTTKGRQFAQGLGAIYQPLSDDADRIYQSMNTVERHNIALIESAEKSTASPQPQWVIACEALASKADAERAAAQWRSRGFKADILWIPDYSSLSGAELWLVYVGPWDYGDKGSVRSSLPVVQRLFPDAYAIKLDQSGSRETIQ